MTTLFINRYESRCGSCNKNADPGENAHVMKSMRGEGCGDTYTNVSSHYPDLIELAQQMRPDLVTTEATR